MSDLSSMIDDTTERLLKKVDNWTIPKSDKEYITIEREVWESTLCQSMKMTAKSQILEIQIKVAIKALRGVRVWANTGNGGEQAVKKLCDKVLKEIEELNK